MAFQFPFELVDRRVLLWEAHEIHGFNLMHSLEWNCGRRGAYFLYFLNKYCTVLETVDSCYSLSIYNTPLICIQSTRSPSYCV